MKKCFLYSISSLILLTASSLFAQELAQTTGAKSASSLKTTESTTKETSGLSDDDFFDAFDIEPEKTIADKKTDTAKTDKSTQEAESSDGSITFEFYGVGFDDDETSDEEADEAETVAKVEEKPKSDGLSDDDFFSAYDNDSSYVPSTSGLSDDAFSEDSSDSDSYADDSYTSGSAISEGKVGDNNMFAMGVDDLIRRANRGDTNAQKTIAEYYATGTILEKNEDLAASYYAKAADMGDMDAAYNAGVLYQTCSNIEDNEDLAFKYFKMAANYNINAMFNLGACYVNGIGTRKDLIKAYFCFTKASVEIPQANEILKKITPVLGVVGIKKAEAFLLSTNSI